ncbi:MAG: AMP-binding protein [Vicinamibacterales bacterium]
MSANFAARIAQTAERGPDRIAIEVARATGDERVRYAELLERSTRVAGWLSGRGLAAGDRVAILSENDAAWIAAYLGILRLGAVAVPLDTAYSAGQVRTVVENAGARLIFASTRHLATAREGTAGTPAAVARLSGGGDGGDEPGEAAIREARPLTAIAEVGADAPAVMLYTSGTTADPKGVVLTHANLEAERASALAVVTVTEDDAVLGVLPLFHALAQMANLLLPLAVGARVVFLETVSSTSLLEALAARGISVFACVPQFFYLIHQRVSAEVARGGAGRRALFRALVGANVWLRDHVGWNPGRLAFARVHRVLGPRMRILVTGGSRFDPAIGRDLYGMGFTLLNAYGLTETSGGATIVRPGDRFTTSVGQPFPGVEVRIGPAESGEDGDPHGEVQIRGAIVMREYYRRPDATAEALEDGWLHTGDLGYLDAEGRVYITGRRKEVIVLASGKNLYPEEIEAHYRQAPTIRELCILGLTRPGEPAAERLHALIVPDEEAMRSRGIVNLRELLRFEIETRSVQLPAHKRILSYDISLEPLPRTTTGKIRRHEVERRVKRLAETARVDAATRPLSEAEREWLSEADRGGLVEAIAARLSRPGLPPDANLELDLGLDSMERIELLTFVEQQRGTRVDAATRQTIFTVRQLVDAAMAAAPAAEAAGGEAGAGEAAGAAAAADPAATWDAVLDQAPDSALIEPLRHPKTAFAAFAFVLIGAVRLAATVLCGVRVAGREHLPREGPCLICPNHQAYLDGFLLAGALPFRLLRRLFFVGAAEYFETPLMRRLARLVNIIPVDPDANLVSAMRAGAAGLRLGRVLILFPEGERSIDGELKAFRKGAAILSAHLGAPIVPVAIDGLFEIWPRGRPFQWRALASAWRRGITLRFGPPMRVARGEYERGTTALRDAVAGLQAEDRRRRAPRP